MALGTQDKEPRGFYSQANADLSAPLNTRPTQASRQTTNAMDQQLRGMAPPLGMPKVAAPSAPAAAGPITQMSQAAAANYAASPNQVPTLSSATPRPAQPLPAAPATSRAYAEPEIPTDVLQRFAQLQSPNMGLQPRGPNLISPQEIYQQMVKSGPIAQAAAAKNTPGVSGGTVSTVPASAFTTRTPADSRAVSEALQAAAARGDWDAIRQHYQSGDGQGAQTGPKGGAIGGSAEAEAQQRNEMFARWGADSALFKLGIGKPGKREAETAQLAIQQYADLANRNAKQGEQADTVGLAQQELTQRAAENQQQSAVEHAKLAQGQPAAAGQQLQNQQAQMMMDLTRKAIGGDQEALKQLQALQGKSPKTPQSEALLEILKAYTTGQATALPGSGVPITQVMQDVSPLLQMLGGQAPAAAPVAPPADGTRGTLNGVRGVIRNGQFIPD